MATTKRRAPMIKASRRHHQAWRQPTVKWLRCWRGMGEIMDELDGAPVVGAEEFRRVASIQGHADADPVPMNPLPLDNGTMLLRSRPGRLVVRDRSGAIVAVLNQDRA